MALRRKARHSGRLEAAVFSVVAVTDRGWAGCLSFPLRFC